jgi:photosystem II stability/assembly factor-like uncharacterized protein
MRYYKFFAFFFLFSLSLVFGGWVALRAPSDEANIDAISFVSPDTGFLTQYWYLWRTTDGGITYQDVTPPGLGSKINDVQFVDMNTGYLSHWGGNIDSIQFTIWKTTDCSNSWNNVFTVPAFINCLFFLNPDYGYIVAQDNNNVYKTTDGGTTWSPVPITGNRVQSVYFLNTQTGYGLSNDRLWKTINGGASWQVAYNADYDIRFFKVQFTSNQYGYIVGNKTYDRGNEREIILKTIDGGYSWEEIFKASSETEITSLVFTGIDTGYIATCKIKEGNDVGRIYKTINGKDFSRIKLPLKRVEFIKPIFFVKGTKTGYVFADVYGTDWGSWILKTVDGSGESLGFWQQLTAIPEKPKKGVLLTYDPESYSLFLLEKGRNRNLWCYDIANDSWLIKKQIPVEIKEGNLTFDGEGLSLLRAKTNECWHYDMVNDSWLKLPNIPGETLVKKGGGITSDWDSLLFVLKGGRKNEFWVFNRMNNQWQRNPDIPETPVYKGGGIACDGEFVYALKGGKTNEMWSYSIEEQRWDRLPNVIGDGFKDGSCLAANPYAEEKRFVFTLKGNTQDCLYFDVESDFWRLTPSIPGKKKIKNGAQLTMDDENVIYAIKGKNLSEIWMNDQFIYSTGISEEKEKPKFDERSKAAAFDIRLSNPTNKLTLNIPQFNWLSISVYDISGRVIKEITSKETKTNLISLGGKIPQGIYFIRLTTPTLKITKKVIIAK